MLHTAAVRRLRIELRLKRGASDAPSYCGRGDLSVTEVCFAVGCSSLGTFSSRFTGLVGMPPSAYRNHGARATAGMPSCVAKQVTRPIRDREGPVTEPQRQVSSMTAMDSTEQPYGVRDCAFRDPAGNLVRINELR
jgi:hypothetical protein